MRLHAPCFGYRNPDQLVWRDESERVVKKAQAQDARNIPIRSLSPSLETRARNYFFSYYVIGVSKTFDFLQEYYGTKPMHKHLSTSIDAASLAYFYVRTQALTALEDARHQYVSALHYVHEALTSPLLVTQDTTLIAILLLDLYEKMMDRRPLVSTSWASHVRGALNLIEMRGNQQFQDPTSLRMLVGLSTKLVISCVVSRTAVPSELISLRTKLEASVKSVNPKWQLTSLMISFAALRAEIQKGELSDGTVVRRATALDDKLLELSETMPRDWKYKTLFNYSKSERIYGSFIHKYRDHHVAQTWNVLRISRIILNEIILEHIHTEDDSSKAATNLDCPALPGCRSSAIATINSLAAEICASVPQFVETLHAHLQAAFSGLPTVRTEFANSDQHLSDRFNLGQDHLDLAILLMQCYTLLFPLYMAARSRYTPNALKSWVMHELHFMASEFGIRNAHTVAQLLREGCNADPYTVHAILGSYAFAA